VKPKKRGSQSKKSGLTLDPKDLQGRLRFIGGSASDHWNSILVNQAFAGRIANARQCQLMAKGISRFLRSPSRPEARSSPGNNVEAYASFLIALSR
jgi:hypothetical protein